MGKLRHIKIVLFNIKLNMFFFEKSEKIMTSGKVNGGKIMERGLYYTIFEVSI